MTLASLQAHLVQALPAPVKVKLGLAAQQPQGISAINQYAPPANSDPAQPAYAPGNPDSLGSPGDQYVPQKSIASDVSALRPSLMTKLKSAWPERLKWHHAQPTSNSNEMQSGIMAQMPPDSPMPQPAMQVLPGQPPQQGPPGMPSMPNPTNGLPQSKTAALWEYLKSYWPEKLKRHHPNQANQLNQQLNQGNRTSQQAAGKPEQPAKPEKLSASDDPAADVPPPRDPAPGTVVAQPMELPDPPEGSVLTKGLSLRAPNSNIRMLTVYELFHPEAVRKAMHPQLFIRKVPKFTISADEIRVNYPRRQQECLEKLIFQLPWKDDDKINPFHTGPCNIVE